MHGKRHDQVVFEWRWSRNTGGHKSRFHCTMHVVKNNLYVLILVV